MAHDPKVLAAAIRDHSETVEYWKALGRFVSTFSLVENRMQITLWRIAGIKPPVAPAIFSGTRAKAAGEFLRRIGEAQKWPKKDMVFLNHIIAQLGELTRVRNDILHYGAKSEGEGKWTVSTALVAHVESQIRITKVSTEILDQMSADLLTIADSLARFRFPRGLFGLGVEEPLPAWRYKSVRPKDGSEKRRNRTQKRSHPPESSRA